MYCVGVETTDMLAAAHDSHVWLLGDRIQGAVSALLPLRHLRAHARTVVGTLSVHAAYLSSMVSTFRTDE